MNARADGAAAGIDVALACMPDAAVHRPSIALGQLKAALTGDGITSKVLYPNLMFLDFAGAEIHGLFHDVRAEDHLVDWIFGQAAFPDFAPDHDRYLDRLLARNRRLGRHDRTELIRRLRDLRAAAPDFIAWAADKVLATRPRIVGATSTFQQHVASLALLREVKRRAPQVVTMIGGANCETVMGRTTHMAFRWIDYVVSGEADAFISDLCGAILRDGTNVPAASLPFGTLGPVHRAEGYPSIESGDGLPRATTTDISSVPVPDYDDYFEALDDCLHGNSLLPGLPIETSRGCWWGAKQHCTFCGLNGGGMAFRAKAPEQVLDEIDVLVDRHRIHSFEAVDNIIDARYLDSLLPMIARSDRNLNLFYETKANLKPGQVQTLAAAGVRFIQPGIESLHSDVLTLMRKGVKAWNNVRLLRLCRQHGIRVSWSILAGFPGEDDAWYQTMAARLPLLTHLQPGGFARLRYDRYSPYFNRADSYGLTLVPSELYAFVYPLPPAQLADQAYFFENAGSIDARRSLVLAEPLNRPGLEAVRRAVEAWRSAWEDANGPPVLAMEVGPEGLVVEDTRACAAARRHVLTGLKRRVLEACEDAPPTHRLLSHAAAEGMDPDAVENALQDLVARRLILEIDGRAIALPLRKPVAPLPDVTMFPGGFNFLPRRPLTAKPASNPAPERVSA